MRGREKCVQIKLSSWALCGPTVMTERGKPTAEGRAQGRRHREGWGPTVCCLEHPHSRGRGTNRTRLAEQGAVCGLAPWETLPPIAPASGPCFLLSWTGASPSLISQPLSGCSFCSRCGKPALGLSSKLLSHLGRAPSTVRCQRLSLGLLDNAVFSTYIWTSHIFIRSRLYFTVCGKGKMM